jgi:hypothetical protein
MLEDQMRDLDVHIGRSCWLLERQQTKYQDSSGRRTSTSTSSESSHASSHQAPRRPGQRKIVSLVRKRCCGGGKHVQEHTESSRHHAREQTPRRFKPPRVASVLRLNDRWWCSHLWGRYSICGKVEVAQRFVAREDCHSRVGGIAYRVESSVQRSEVCEDLIGEED